MWQHEVVDTFAHPRLKTDEKSGGTDGLALMMQVKYSHLFALSDIYSVFCVT